MREGQAFQAPAALQFDAVAVDRVQLHAVADLAADRVAVRLVALALDDRAGQLGIALTKLPLSTRSRLVAGGGALGSWALVPKRRARRVGSLRIDSWLTGEAATATGLRCRRNQPAACQARLMLMAMIRAAARRAGAYRCSQREEAPEKGNTSLLVFIVMSEDRRGIIAVRCQ